MRVSMEHRMRRLEIWNGLLITVLVAGFALAVLGGAGSADPGTIRCTRLEVVDAEGALVAWIGTDTEGSRGLFVLDEKGGQRITLTHDDAQTALYLWDDVGTIRVGTAQFAHGGGGFALHGPESRGGAVLYHKDAGSLTFYDAEGGETMRVPER